MAELSLTKTRIRAGAWEGVLSVAGEGNHQPELYLAHLDRDLGEVEVTEDPDRRGRFAVRAPIPPELIGEGIQNFAIRDRATDARLSAFTIIAGEPAEDDLRTELELLRAELDMLKKAFRRHCLETM